PSSLVQPQFTNRDKLEAYPMDAVFTTSNRAPFLFPGKTRRILDTYFHQLDITVEDEDDLPALHVPGGILQVRGSLWPAAVDRRLLPMDVDDEKACAEVMQQHGRQGFIDLLVAVAQDLIEPLTVQVVHVRNIELAADPPGPTTVNCLGQPGDL